MHFRIFYIVLLLVSFPLMTWAQNDLAKYSRDRYGNEMTNKNVIDANRLHGEGLTEQSLRKGLEILASHIPLTAVDSFNTYQTIAYNLRSMEAHKLALEYAEIAKKVRQGMDPENTQGISWVSSYYSAVKDYNKSISYMQRDIPYFQNTQDTLALLKHFNNIGFTFYLNNQNDSATVYYNKIIDFDRHDNEKYKGIFGLATGNLGVLYFDEGEYPKALTNLLIDAELNKDYDSAGWFNAMNVIGECYYRMGDFEKAESALLEIVDFTPDNAAHKFKTYQLLSRIYEKIGNSSLSLFYLQEYINLQNDISKAERPLETLVNQLSDTKMGGIRKDLETSKAKVDLMNAEIQAVKNENRLFLTIAIFSILIVIAIIVGYKYRGRKTEKNKFIDTENNSTEIKM